MSEQNEMRCRDLSDEKSRTYQVFLREIGFFHTITIDNPVSLYDYPSGHSFHRVWDGETLFLAPAPGIIRENGVIVGYCDLSWIPKNTDNPCKF